MRAYIETIAYFMMLSAFAEMLVQENFRRDLKVLTGIMLMLVIFSPLKGLLEGENKIDLAYTVPERENYEDKQREIIEDAIKKELELRLAEETGAQKAEAELDENNNVVSVCLYGVGDEKRQAAADICGIGVDKVKTKGGED